MSFWEKLSKRNAFQTELDIADRLADTPEPTFWSRWFGGVIVPVLLMDYGWRCCASQSAVFDQLPLQGRTAVAFGIVWISAGLFAHFHWFWSSLKRLSVLADPGKALALLGFIGSGGYVVWSIVTH